MFKEKDKRQKEKGGNTTVGECVDSLKGTKIIAQGKAEGRHHGSAGHTESLPEGKQQTDPPRLSASVGKCPAVAAFMTRPSSDLVDEIADTPLPAKLFGDLWYEGELALMFGDRGTGKSILAVQIAETLARGRPFVLEPDKVSLPKAVYRTGPKGTFEPQSQPLTADCRPPTADCPVLYFDLKLSDRQFALRYIWEPGDGDEKISDWGHRFPASFLRSSFDVSTAPRELSPREVSEFVLDGIEQEIERTGAKTIVVDSLDRFNGSGLLRSRDIAFVMARLRRLKAAHGLSILVLANLPRRNPNLPLAAGNMISTRTACAFADSVFAVGQCRWDERIRYVKHLSSRSADVIFDSEYLPAFTLCRDEGVFLSFFHDNFYPESAMLDPYLSKVRLERADRVKEMAASGLSQREIALQIALSLGSVNRALRMWSPFDDRPKAPPPQKPPERKRPTKTAKTVEQAPKTENGKWEKENSGAGPSRADAPVSPGAETNTGDPPNLGPEARDPEPVPLGPHALLPPGRRFNEYDRDPTVVTDSRGIVCNAGHPMFGLKHSSDANGREIFVAREREFDGKPVLWYTYTARPDRFNRWERDGHGSIRDIVEAISDRYEKIAP